MDDSKLLCSCVHIEWYNFIPGMTFVNITRLSCKTKMQVRPHETWRANQDYNPGGNHVWLHAIGTVPYPLIRTGIIHAMQLCNWCNLEL